ncbi:MAG: TIGR00159 family protein [Cytophagales bacterium]|nr:TIGR00159 family protein [Cytophaga sp.]
MIFLFNIFFINVSWIDILDVLLVAVLLYKLYKLLKGSVAVKVFLGILFIYTFYLIVKATGMELLRSILGQFMGVGVLAAFILFQQEIRKFLLMIGKSTTYNNSIIKGWFYKTKVNTKDDINLSPFIDSVKILSQTNTGALIVFGKSSELKFYSESGDILDAELSKRLLISIFQKNSPLHDGAVIISAGRIRAARCILPVSENDRIPAHMGLRHRAAIGLTEVTDSVVLVVSEETGSVSIAYNGEIYYNLNKGDLRGKLRAFLYDTEEQILQEVQGIRFEER